MSNDELKQVIVLRKDLNMRKGKMIAQGAHASMKATLDSLNNPMTIEWLTGKFTKIALGCNSEEELLNLYEDAKSENMICALIQDAGLTEFDGIPTYTAIAIGPDYKENIDLITGHLKLL